MGLQEEHTEIQGVGRPHHALSLPTVESVVAFIVNYSEQLSLALPGWIPGYSRSDMQLLPSSTSKKSIWELFKFSWSVSPSNQSVAYSTFCKLWRTLVPNVKTMKPMSLLDLPAEGCYSATDDECKLGRQISGLKGCTGTSAHCEFGAIFLQRSSGKGKAAVHASYTENGILQLPPLPRPPQSASVRVHYSFLSFKSTPTMYFLTCRKCSIFGVCSFPNKSF